MDMPRTRSRSLPWGVWLSLLAILLISLAGLFAPVIAPYDPTQMQIGQSHLPPAWYDTPGKPGQPDHLLGTDLYGRDILSHLIHGARAGMFLVLVAMPIATIIGLIVGILAGFGQRWLEPALLRLMDVMSAVPAFMFAVIIILILRATPAGTVSGGLITITLAFALIQWVSLAKLIRISVMQIRSQVFMEAARSLGAGAWHQTIRHVLPHLFNLILVWVINNIPAVILMEALMGYVGIQILQVNDGTGFQDLSWGGLILLGRTQLNRNPFILLAPTLCILVISMSFSVIGEYLNERLNPHYDTNNLY